MRSTPWFLAIVGLSMLGGCATQIAPAAPPMSWGYIAASDQEPARLAYGVDDSDEIGIVFICDQTKDRVEFIIPAVEGHDVPAMHLRGGKVARRFEALAPEGDGSDDLVHFQAGRRDPVLAAFVATGSLALDPYGTFVSHDARTAAERAAVATFAKACGLG